MSARIPTISVRRDNLNALLVATIEAWEERGRKKVSIEDFVEVAISSMQDSRVVTTSPAHAQTRAQNQVSHNKLKTHPFGGSSLRQRASRTMFSGV